MGRGGGEDRGVGRLAAAGALRVCGVAGRVAGAVDVGRLLVTSGLRPADAGLWGGPTALVRGAADREGTVTRVDDPVPVEGLTFVGLAVAGLAVVGRAEFVPPAWVGLELLFPPTPTAVPRRLRSDGREPALGPAPAEGVALRGVSRAVARGVPLLGSTLVGRAAGGTWPGSAFGRRDVEGGGTWRDAVLGRRGAVAGTTCSEVPLERRDAAGGETLCDAGFGRRETADLAPWLGEALVGAADRLVGVVWFPTEAARGSLN